MFVDSVDCMVILIFFGDFFVYSDSECDFGNVGM